MYRPGDRVSARKRSPVESLLIGLASVRGNSDSPPQRRGERRGSQRRPIDFAGWQGASAEGLASSYYPHPNPLPQAGEGAMPAPPSPSPSPARGRGLG